jgi:hypothetical protein
MAMVPNNEGRRETGKQQKGNSRMNEKVMGKGVAADEHQRGEGKGFTYGQHMGMQHP